MRATLLIFNGITAVMVIWRINQLKRMGRIVM
jgi:hypothetical protein